MDKNTTKKKDLKENIIVLFILICTILIVFDVGSNF